MSCKSVLYMTQNANASVDAGGVIPFSTITRRMGQAIRVDGTTVALLEPGYYEITANAIVQPEAAAAISMQILENGQQIAGAVSTAVPAATSDSTQLVVPNVIARVYCNTVKMIAAILTAEATVTSAAMTITKV